MHVTIFCSVHNVGDAYTQAAREFAVMLAQGGHTLVWGGSNHGTMKVIADAAQGAGGRIVGISMEPMKERARQNADEMVIAKNLPERKALLLARGDAIVALPGGIGTLDEVTEVLEYKKQGMHHKPVAFLNTNGFYDGMQQQLERMEQEGFLPKSLSEFLYFAATPAEAFAYITTHEC